MNAKRLGLVCLAFVPWLAGCYALLDRVDDFSMETRAKWLAQKAWWRMEPYYEDVSHERDFAKGFKAGYADVVFGRGGEQPPLAPRSYWGAGFHSAQGRHKVYAWFDGYSHGALAAEQDGLANLGRVPLSPRTRQHLQAFGDGGTRPAPQRVEQEQHHGAPEATEPVPPPPEGTEETGQASVPDRTADAELRLEFPSDGAANGETEAEQPGQ